MGVWRSHDQQPTGVNGVITSLHSITNKRNGERLIIGGLDNGGITVWDLKLAHQDIFFFF